MKEEALVFIVSQPRSGSTYLQRLLSNTENVNTTSEHWALLNFAQVIKPDLISGRFDAKMAHKAFIDYLEKHPSSNFRKGFKELLLALYEPLFNGHQFVIDKTPRYWEMLPELQELFSKSKFIILKRNPVEVVTSIIKTWEIKSLEELNYYRRDLLEAPFVLEEFCEKNKHNTSVSVVHYEELKNKGEVALEKLTAFIGYPFSKNMMNIEANRKTEGLFGDPFQNKKYEKIFTKEKSNTFIISDELQDFIAGYALFANQFKVKKAALQLHEITNKHESFKRFLELPAYRHGMSTNDFKVAHLEKEKRILEKELGSILHSTSYRFYQKMITPFKKIKQILKVK